MSDGDERVDAPKVDRVELAELVELEEVTRHTARWESINSLGYTEPEIRTQAAVIAATALAPLLASNPGEVVGPDVVARAITEVATELEPYLRGRP